MRLARTVGCSGGALSHEPIFSQGDQHDQVDLCGRHGCDTALAGTGEQCGRRLGKLHLLQSRLHLPVAVHVRQWLLMRQQMLVRQRLQLLEQRLLLRRLRLQVMRSSFLEAGRARQRPAGCFLQEGSRGRHLGAGGKMPAGNVRGDRIRNCLFTLVRPKTTSTALLETPNSLARNRTM